MRRRSGEGASRRVCLCAKKRSRARGGGEEEERGERGGKGAAREPAKGEPTNCYTALWCHSSLPRHGPGIAGMVSVHSPIVLSSSSSSSSPSFLGCYTRFFTAAAAAAASDSLPRSLIYTPLPLFSPSCFASLSLSLSLLSKWPMLRAPTWLSVARE